MRLEIMGGLSLALCRPLPSHPVAVNLSVPVTPLVVNSSLLKGAVGAAEALWSHYDLPFPMTLGE
jgi:hypothetical protein